MQSGRAVAVVEKGYGSRAEEVFVASRSPISHEPQPSRSRTKALFNDSDEDFTLFRFPLDGFPERSGSVHIMRYSQD